MATSTATATLTSRAATPRAENDPAVRPDRAPRAGGRCSRPEVGASRLRDARRDLSMFDPRLPEVLPVQAPTRGEWLVPLLAPVRSAPSRRSARSPGPSHRANAMASGSLRDAEVGVAMEDAPLGVMSTRSPRAERRLTTRGYLAVLGLLTGGIAICSAITVGQSGATPTVQTTQVVARGGESIEGLADRSAQGRDVRMVAESIRAANGLAAGELPEAGEVLIVPGS